MDLPQFVVPALLYNITLCALGTAMGWHLINLAGRLAKVRKGIED